MRGPPDVERSRSQTARRRFAQMGTLVEGEVIISELNSVIRTHVGRGTALRLGVARAKCRTADLDDRPSVEVDGQIVGQRAPQWAMRQIEKAVRFYVDLLGFAENWRHEQLVAQVDRQSCELILSSQEPDKTGRGRMFLSLDLETLEAVRAPADGD